MNRGRENTPARAGTPLLLSALPVMNHPLGLEGVQDNYGHDENMSVIAPKSILSLKQSTP